MGLIVPKAGAPFTVVSPVRIRARTDGARGAIADRMEDRFRAASCEGTDAIVDDRSARRVMPPVSYAVAWKHEPGPRLVGSATVDIHGLVLVGREPGAPNGEERLAVTAGGVEHVELSRSSALPAIAAQLEGRRVVIELLLGGWGAAHDLADALAPPLAQPPASQRVRTVATADRILPGR
jgi:hypothetical protein